MSMVNPGTKVMCFPDFGGPPKEFLVVERDSIGKAYLVQWPGSAPKREDEKSLHRLLLSYPQHMRNASVLMSELRVGSCRAAKSVCAQCVCAQWG